MPMASSSERVRLFGRILVVTSNFPRWQGDSTTPFVLHLAQDLQNLGWHVDVLAPHSPGSARREVIEGVTAERFRYLWPTRLQTVCYQGGALINLRLSPRSKRLEPLPHGPFPSASVSDYCSGVLRPANLGFLIVCLIRSRIDGAPCRPPSSFDTKGPSPAFSGVTPASLWFCPAPSVTQIPQREKPNTTAAAATTCFKKRGIPDLTSVWNNTQLQVTLIKLCNTITVCILKYIGHLT